jgi:hypothetical protein
MGFGGSNARSAGHAKLLTTKEKKNAFIGKKS